LPPNPPAADAGAGLARHLIAAWRGRGVLACALWPLSVLFGIVVRVRRALYRRGVLLQEPLPVPVVVIGNLSVGGVGKTPLTITLVESLRAAGHHPGVISRGHARAADAPPLLHVTATTEPGQAGDEPALISRRTGVPVVVGRDRVAAARALLAAAPQTDVILSDDGLQHYRLGRHVELVVTDARGWQNGWLLPAGPLREPLSRLAGVDALIGNGIAVPPAPSFGLPFFAMQLQASRWYALHDPAIQLDAAQLAALPGPLHAVAGIGDPERFFATLERMGLAVVRHAFADHYQYTADDLAFGAGTILTTEKDAVKFFALGALPLEVWVLPVSAELTPDLTAFLLEKLNGSPPA
jgi:tetraacyldisaccharide 4'-kinase